MRVEKDYEGTIPIINDMLNTMENKYKEQSFTVLLYTTLANAYRHTRDFDKAFKALAISETLIDNKERTISER